MNKELPEWMKQKAYEYSDLKQKQGLSEDVSFSAHFAYLAACRMFVERIDTLEKKASEEYARGEADGIRKVMEWHESHTGAGGILLAIAIEKHFAPTLAKANASEREELCDSAFPEVKGEEG